MDHQELDEILKAANAYLYRLKTLDEQLEQAITQVNVTYQDTITRISETFFSIKETLTTLLNEREKFLLDQAHKVKYFNFIVAIFKN